MAESGRRTSRSDTQLVGGHFPRAVAKKLRMLAVENDTTVQALLEEAIDLLFAKHGAMERVVSEEGREVVEITYPLVAPLMMDRPQDHEGPWFDPLLLNLAKNARLHPLKHQHIEVTASSLGMATAEDFDIIIRLTSILLMQKRAGVASPPREVAFHPYSFLKDATDAADSRKGPSGRQYALFLEKLERLRTTTIAMRQPGRAQENFSWLSDYRTLSDSSDDASLAMTARLPDFLWRRIVMDEAVISLDPGYLSLSGGWSRWLHMVARQVAPAAIPEAALREGFAYVGTPEKLRSDIRKAIVPGYALSFRHDGQGQPYTLHIDPA